jgi:hypothetical protein
MPRPGSRPHFDRLWVARITGFRRQKASLNPKQIINAFLTLSAVTEW